MEDKLIGTERAAEIIGVKQRQVQRYCDDGVLPHQVISGRYLIWESDARKFSKNRPKRGPKPGSKRGAKDLR